MWHEIADATKGGMCLLASIKVVPTESKLHFAGEQNADKGTKLCRQCIVDIDVQKAESWQ